MNVEEIEDDDDEKYEPAEPPAPPPDYSAYQKTLNNDKIDEYYWREYGGEG